MVTELSSLQNIIPIPLSSTVSTLCFVLAKVGATFYQLKTNGQHILQLPHSITSDFLNYWIYIITSFWMEKSIFFSPCLIEFLDLIWWCRKWKMWAVCFIKYPSNPRVAVHSIYSWWRNIDYWYQYRASVTLTANWKATWIPLELWWEASLRNLSGLISQRGAVTQDYSICLLLNQENEPCY